MCKGAALPETLLPPPPVLFMCDVDLQEQFTGSKGCLAANMHLGAVLKAEIRCRFPLELAVWIWFY